MLQLVPENINFPSEEENILHYWNTINAFEECMKKSEGKPRFSFYDGPPFATGLPHYGHILAGTIKDIVTRYAYQNGYHVDRRFGWDCHGLPVEYEIDKALNIKGPEDVVKMGIKVYNDECRKIVTRYAKEWEIIIKRIGRWIDFKNDYKTLYPWYMESIWWVFSELWNKGLVYRGVKVMPFSTACNTPLSNFESGQNYKEVVDPAIIVMFPLVSDSAVSLLAWTTTPWTLPSNLAVCVNPLLEYVKIKVVKTEKYYVLMQSRLSFIFKNPDDYVILETFPGSKLEGERYMPLFPYFTYLKEAFVVLTDKYVTEESGTGIVHQAPYFGEDDYRVCLRGGVITRDQDIVCPVDSSGCFIMPVTDFVGQYVKDADKNIIKHLKSTNRVFNVSTVKHNYPFCWRSETPLIYKAVPSWFVRVQQFSKDLLDCNQKTYWVPDFVKEKRFGNWLKEARDWAVSRNRYWGTPIPLWMSEDGEEIVCVASIAELERLSGVLVKDLHRENIDDIVIPSVNPNNPPLKRIPQVFDCWFESGSMPYAQMHFPFENKDIFEKRFPADFIAEGIDQTRGWFYTLLVISSALFNKPPFKNLIANGLILAGDGQKMSKRKKNYPDPIEIVNKFGADALRLYLINSPVVRAENLRFKEEGVRDMLKEVFIPWYNAYRFLVQNILQIQKETDVLFTFKGNEMSTNIMDRWILSFTQSLLMFVHNEMLAYHLYSVVPKLVQFIDYLTNWYVRMNRQRFKEDNDRKDCEQALATLSNVLFTMVRIMAPFTPFFCEYVFQNLKYLMNVTEESIHYMMLPEPRINLIDTNIEISVSKMQTVIELGRIIRDRKTLPNKFPLREIVVIHNDQNYLNDIVRFIDYIKKELNIREVTLSSDKSKYGVTLKAEPDLKVLGIRLKSAIKEITPAIKALTDQQIQRFVKDKCIDVLGHKLEFTDLRIKISFTGPAAAELVQKYEAHSNNEILVLLDITLDKSLEDEGVAREIINRIQKLRKKAHLIPTDQIIVCYNVQPVDCELSRIAKEYTDFIRSTIKVPFVTAFSPKQSLLSESHLLKDGTIILIIERVDNEAPVTCCRYINVQLNGLEPGRYGAPKSFGNVLLENPVGQNMLTLKRLKKEVEILFSLQNQHFVLKTQNGKPLVSDRLVDYHKQTIMVEPTDYTLYIVAEPVHVSLCPVFVNIEMAGKRGCILLPGNEFDSRYNYVLQMASIIFDVSKATIVIGPLDRNELKLS